MPIVPDSLTLDDPSIDRSEVLAGLRIILLHKSQEQYTPIIKGCGAEAIEAFAFPTNSWKSSLESLLSHPEAGDSSYVLRDEFTGKADPQVDLSIIRKESVIFSNLESRFLCFAWHSLFGARSPCQSHPPTHPAIHPFRGDT